MTQLKTLQLDGRYLDAWSLIQDFDPPEQWPSPQWRLRGARLIETLGDRGRATRMYFKEWRRRESRAFARSEMFYLVLNRRGAYLALQWLKANPPAPDESPGRHEDHHGHRAIALTMLRDFDEAQSSLARGDEFEPGSRWLQLLRADLLQAQDLRAEALATAREVLSAEPMYVSAICSSAELLSELDRDEEAVTILQEGSHRVQSGQLLAQLAGLLVELKRYDDAWAVLDRYEKTMPLSAGESHNWLCGQRCDIASHLGKVEEALHWAEQVTKGGFYKRLATKLRAAKGPLRKLLLPVPFIQQHQSTCAPAAITSIARFWGENVKHLDLADSICYDGTPDYRERQWADGNGWKTREFRVTVESAKTLLDAGMPFVLNTVYPGGAHAQVVMGYDDCRTVLFIRDPGNRHTSEFLATEALEEQAPFGPRGFVMVPEAEAARLAALDLPDAGMYDLTHAIDVAIERHDRAAAIKALDVLRRDHEGHLLRWHGELAIARYDGNHSQALNSIEALLQIHPQVVNWQTERLQMIREVRGRAATVAALREVCAQKESHAIHWRMLARELHWDERHTVEARQWLKKVHRTRLDAVAILTEANIWWERREREKATGLYRLAACIEDKNESLVMSYFRATRWVGQTGLSLAMLRRRFDDQGSLSAQPAVTLYRALNDLNLGKEGLDVLEESLRRRPDDADHAIFVAGELVLWNRTERARAILSGIRRSGRAAAWHRAQARLARQSGDATGQLRHWRAVLDDDPLDTDAYRAIAWLLELQEGVQIAIASLEEASRRFPFHWQLHIALLDWSRDQGIEKWENAVRQLIRIDPDNGWARQELADVLRAARRFAEAHAELNHAARLDEENAPLHAMRARVLEGEGRTDEARAECRLALALDVDDAGAMKAIVRLCRTQEQRLEELRFIQSELQQQTTNGDGVLEFADVARPYLSEAELEQVLRESWEARPDLWQTGVKLAEHLRHTERTQEAIEVLRGLTEKFPLMPRVWMELGLGLEASHDRAAAIEAASHIRELSPRWNWGMRALAELKRKDGDYAGAREILEEALRHSPRDAIHHGWLADVLWRLNESAAALEHLTQAVAIDPAYQWAWNMLEAWGGPAGKPDAAREAAARLQQERPADARTWLIAAEHIADSAHPDKRLAMLDKAIAIDPEDWRPVETKARILANAGRFHEALRVCRDHPSKSVPLRMREAWVLNRRGSRDEAIGVMEAALKDDPNNIWGWQLLVDWWQEAKQLARAEEACRQLVRLQLASAEPLGYLGGLQLMQGKRLDARATFERALKLEPDYHFAFQKLFWILIEDCEWLKVAELVARSRPHQTSIQHAFRQFALNCRKRSVTEACEWLEKITADPADEPEIFGFVVEELRLIGDSGKARAQKLVARALTGPAANVNAGALYVNIAKLRQRLPALRVLKRLPAESEAAERAEVQHVYWIGDYWSAHHNDLENFFALSGLWRWRRMVREHREWYRRRMELYGAVSYTLISLNRFKQNVEWLSDWRERPDLPPFILNNLVVSLHRLGRGADALQVIERGMHCPKHGGIKLRFHLWAAIDAALKEDLSRVGTVMDSVNPAELDDHGKRLKTFLDLLMEFQQPGKEPPTFRQVRERLKQFMAHHRKDLAMIATTHQACQFIARKLHSRFPLWWFRLNRSRQLLFRQA